MECDLIRIRITKNASPKLRRLCESIIPFFEYPLQSFSASLVCVHAWRIPRIVSEFHNVLFRTSLEHECSSLRCWHQSDRKAIARCQNYERRAGRFIAKTTVFTFSEAQWDISVLLRLSHIALPPRRCTLADAMVDAFDGNAAFSSGNDGNKIITAFVSSLW